MPLPRTLYYHAPGFRCSSYLLPAYNALACPYVPPHTCRLVRHLLLPAALTYICCCSPAPPPAALPITLPCHGGHALPLPLPLLVLRHTLAFAALYLYLYCNAAPCLLLPPLPGASICHWRRLTPPTFALPRTLHTPPATPTTYLCPLAHAFNYPFPPMPLCHFYFPTYLCFCLPPITCCSACVVPYLLPFTLLLPHLLRSHYHAFMPYLVPYHHIPTLFYHPHCTDYIPPLPVHIPPRAVGCYTLPYMPFLPGFPSCCSVLLPHPSYLVTTHCKFYYLSTALL